MIDYVTCPRMYLIISSSHVRIKAQKSWAELLISVEPYLIADININKSTKQYLLKFEPTTSRIN